MSELPAGRLRKEPNPAPGQEPGFTPQYGKEGTSPPQFEDVEGKNGAFNIRVKEIVDQSLKTELQAIKAELQGVLDVQVATNKMELYGKSLAERPSANAVRAGTVYIVVDGEFEDVWMSDGTIWVEV